MGQMGRVMIRQAEININLYFSIHFSNPSTKLRIVSTSSVLSDLVDFLSLMCYFPSEFFL